MTTLVDVISKVDSIKPNVFSQSQKRDWIYGLEVQIREFKNLYTDEETDMLFFKRRKCHSVSRYAMDRHLCVLPYVNDRYGKLRCGYV